MCGYLLANFFLWNTALLKPMKLIAVFVHEMSHATACWMTGGKVTAIEVYNNEGEFALMCTVPLYLLIVCCKPFSHLRSCRTTQVV